MCLVAWSIATGAKFFLSTNVATCITVLEYFNFLLVFRRRAKLYPLDGSESTWGFGQLVPLLLIAIPLLSAFELFYGMYTNLPRFCII